MTKSIRNNKSHKSSLKSICRIISGVALVCQPLDALAPLGNFCSRCWRLASSGCGVPSEYDIGQVHKPRPSGLSLPVGLLHRRRVGCRASCCNFVSPKGLILVDNLKNYTKNYAKVIRTLKKLKK